MKTPVLFSILISTFLGPAPDLCEDPLLDPSGAPISDSSGQTLSRYCEWTGPDAPRLDANICCTIEDSTARCELANSRGYCGAGARLFCEYGAVDDDGVVSCARAYPDACDEGLCVAGPAGEPEPYEVLCCSPGGVCVGVTLETIDDCVGSFVGCDHGIENTDGTVECVG